MNQTKSRYTSGQQVEYLGRWVDRTTFCAFVYNGSEQKLAKNYNEYEELIASGIWFPTNALALAALRVKEAKQKQETNEVKETTSEVKEPKGSKKRVSVGE